MRVLAITASVFMSLLPALASCAPKSSSDFVLLGRQRAVLKEFAHILYGQKKVAEAFNKHVDANYIQHDPQILDGREAAIAAVTAQFNATPSLTVTVKHLLSDLNYGMLHSEFDFEPTKVAIMDLYRFEGTTIVEHWDLFTVEEANQTNPHPYFKH